MISAKVLEHAIVALVVRMVFVLVLVLIQMLLRTASAVLLGICIVVDLIVFCKGDATSVLATVVEHLTSMGR